MFVELLPFYNVTLPVMISLKTGQDGEGLRAQALRRVLASPGDLGWDTILHQVSECLTHDISVINTEH